MVPAAAAFAYSKDWLVTDLHRLSSFNQFHSPAGKLYTRNLNGNQDQDTNGLPGQNYPLDSMNSDQSGHNRDNKNGAKCRILVEAHHNRYRRIRMVIMKSAKEAAELVGENQVMTLIDN